jgi:hypothetical protein
MVLNELQTTNASRQMSDQIFDPTSDDVSYQVYYVVYEQVYDPGLIHMWNQLLMKLGNNI